LAKRTEEVIVRGFVYDAIRRRTTPRMRQIIKSRSWAMPLLVKLFGSDIYSRSYYEQVEQMESASVALIADWIGLALKPTSVVDVGCGPGHLIEALHRHNIRILGLDYSAAAKAQVERKGLPFQAFDLTRPGVLPGSPWDLAVCCEVAEHLDARHASVLVENLASASDTVFLTAAEVGQGGLNHLNEQPNSYWIAKFVRRGFALDENLTAQARTTFAERGVVHYLAKPMVLRRVENDNSSASGRGPSISTA
jgi:SAM-dependent methyltransferase